MQYASQVLRQIHLCRRLGIGLQEGEHLVVSWAAYCSEATGGDFIFDFFRRLEL